MAKLHKGNATRAILLKHLVEGICKVSFIKRDGTVRNAYCTLHSGLIPTQFEKAIEKIFLPDANQERLPYWDVVEGKWKSFYVEKVELFITADELKKDLPPSLQKKEEKATGDIIQDVDENQQSNMDKVAEKKMRSIDKSKNEKTIDPINRNNISRIGGTKSTRSNVTKRMEEKKARLDNARNVINKLRREAEERRKK